MRSRSLRACLALFIPLGPVLAWPTPEDVGSMSLENLFQRKDEFNVDDLSFIKSIAAVGDSYSAGIGAGNRLDGVGDYHCSRYDHSYPYLLNQDGRLGDPSKRKFQFLSCSGAKVEEVIEEQIPLVDSGQDVILLSAGGNDAELVDILNQCIFQFLAIADWQGFAAEIAKLLKQPWAEWFAWEKSSRGCEGQLEVSRKIVESSEFADRLDDLLDTTQKKLSSDGIIYYTGYAKFFGTDYSSACDKVTWSFWLHKLYNVWEDAARLTSSRRRAMNDLVDLMNEKLEDAVSRAGDKVKFVDYDQIVGHFKGRYCEDGVDESDAESNTRPMLMFYEFRTMDPGGNTPFKRSSEEHRNGSFGGDFNAMAQAVNFLTDGTSGYRHEFLVEEDDSVGTNSLVGDLLGWISVPNLIPDGYGRIFHPQVFLHELIAELVLFHISNRNLEDNDYDTLPLMEEAISSCSLDSVPDDEDDDQEEEEEEEPKLETPDTSKNDKKCYNSGQRADYGSIEAAAESFCKYNLETSKDGPVFSNFRQTEKKSPPGKYHFIVTFEVFEGCEWEYSFDDCMRYFKVPMDSCDCSAKGNKQGGTVKNNCIYARLDPNFGL